MKEREIACGLILAEGGISGLARPLNREWRNTEEKAPPTETVEIPSSQISLGEGYKFHCSSENFQLTACNASADPQCGPVGGNLRCVSLCAHKPFPVFGSKESQKQVLLIAFDCF